MTHLPSNRTATRHQPPAEIDAFDFDFDPEDDDFLDRCLLDIRESPADYRSL